MDDNSSKALYIGAMVLASIIIISTVIVVFTQLNGIFNKYGSQSQGVFVTNANEFSKYDNTTVKGMDVLNLLKKYLDDDNVQIIVTYNAGSRSNVLTNNAGGKSVAIENIKNVVAYKDVYTESYSASYELNGVTKTVTFVEQ